MTIYKSWNQASSANIGFGNTGICLAGLTNPANNSIGNSYRCVVDDTKLTFAKRRIVGNKLTDVCQVNDLVMVKVSHR